MTARNPIKFAAGQAHRAEILSILDRYDWRVPFAVLPPAKAVLAQMSCIPALSLRSVQGHILTLRRLERERLRIRNLSPQVIHI